MKVCLTFAPAPVTTSPLRYTDIPIQQPLGMNVLVRVRACAVCRTDLHIVEGELPWRKRPIIPGHQIVGTIEATGNEAKDSPLERVWASPGCITPAAYAGTAYAEQKTCVKPPTSLVTASTEAMRNTP